MARPFFIDAADAEQGLRFYGPPPRGIAPPGAEFRYMLTVPCDEQAATELSVFLHEDIDRVLDGLHVLQRPGSALIQVVSHSVAPRGERVDYGFGPVGYGARLLDPIPDVVDGEIYSAHKLGGRPFFLHGEPDVEDPINRAIDEEGFHQVIQLAFPAYPEDADVDYDWPFGDGMFHLIAKIDRDQLNWLALWE